MLVQCFGIIFQNDFQYMGITAAQISFLLHLNNSMFCVFCEWKASLLYGEINSFINFIGLLSSPFLKKYSYRTVAIFGASLMTTGIFFTTFANSYCTLLFTVSILTGEYQAIILSTNYAIKKNIFGCLFFIVRFRARDFNASSVFGYKYILQETSHSSSQFWSDWRQCFIDFHAANL